MTKSMIFNFVMGRPYFLVPMLFFLTAAAVFAEGKTVAVGRARLFNDNRTVAGEQALKNAQRLAVEQQVGVFIDAGTITENWRVIKDNIYTHSSGFISSFSILKSELSPDENYWEVTIEAVVESKKIKNRLNVLRILQQKTNNRRYALIYRRESERSYQPQKDPVVIAKNTIKKTMAKHGFRFFDVQYDTDIKKLLKALLKKNIDYYIFFEVTPNYYASSGQFGLKPVAVTITMTAYLTAGSQEIISIEDASLRVLTNSPQQSPQWLQSLNESSKNSAVQVSGEMIDSIAGHYAGIDYSGDYFTLIFTNLDENAQTSLLAMLKNIDGYTSLREMKRISGLLSVEYKSRLRKDRLHTLIVEQGKKKGILLDTVLGSGNRFVFKKK